MNKIDRIIQAINEDNTLDEDWPCYFDKSFSLCPMIFSKGYDTRSGDWNVSYSLGDTFWHMLLGLNSYSVEVFSYNDSRHTLPLTKNQRKALDKAYWGWYERQKQRHRAFAKRAAM